MLLGMSVIGKNGLVPNPYKGTLKYYVDWATRGSRSARLACNFNVELGRNYGSAHTPSCVSESKSALSMPLESVPRTNEEFSFCREIYQAYGKHLLEALTNSIL